MAGGLSPYLADRLSSHSTAGSLHRPFAGEGLFCVHMPVVYLTFLL